MFKFNLFPATVGHLMCLCNCKFRIGLCAADSCTTYTLYLFGKKLYYNVWNGLINLNHTCYPTIIFRPFVIEENFGVLFVRNLHLFKFGHRYHEQDFTAIIVSIKCGCLEPGQLFGCTF